MSDVSPAQLKALCQPLVAFFLATPYFEGCNKFNVNAAVMVQVLEQVFANLHTLQTECTGRTSPSRLFSRLALLKVLAPSALLVRMFDGNPADVLKALSAGLPQMGHGQPHDMRHFESFKASVAEVGVTAALNAAAPVIITHRGQINPSLELAHLILKGHSICGEELLAEDSTRLWHLLRAGRDEAREDARAGRDAAQDVAGFLDGQFRELAQQTGQSLLFASARADAHEQDIQKLKRRKIVRFTDGGS